MDINRELFFLSHKYGLDEEYPEFWRKYEIVDAINELFSNFGKDIYTIKCGGNHTKQLYKILTEENRLKIKYVIDRSLKNNDDFPLWNVLNQASAIKKGIKSAVISTYKFEKDAILELLSDGIEGVSIYEYLRDKGISLHEAFFDFFQPQITYIDVWILRERYQKSNDKNKEILLRRIIFHLIIIKDFVTAKKYIEEYISKKYSEYKKYQSYMNDLENLFSSIKKQVGIRTQKDIIINWIDGVHFEDAANMPLLSKDKGIVFSNAYTVMPFTSPVIKAMMTADADRLFDARSKDIFTGENSIFLKELFNRGYEFRFLSYWRLNKKRFPDDMEPDYNYGAPRQMPGVPIGCSTQLQWDALSILLLSRKPVCVIIHSFNETHLPHIYSDMDYAVLGNIFTNPNWADYKNYRYNGGIAYIDAQIQWYRKFYNISSIRIYMTDHGPIVNEKNYSDARSHVALKVCGSDWRADSIESRLFSLLYFWKLICWIIDGSEDYDSIFSDYVLLEANDIYNETLVQIMCDWIGKKDPRISFIRHYLKYKAVKTEKDIFVKYERGPELYFRKNDFAQNLIHNKKYKDRILYLRNIVGTEWIEHDGDYGDKFPKDAAQLVYDLITEEKVAIEW